MTVSAEIYDFQDRELAQLHGLPAPGCRVCHTGRRAASPPGVGR